MRLLRGRVVIREDLKADQKRFPSLIVPDVTSYDRDSVAASRTYHRGRVLGMGPPALTKQGHEVPHGFTVGDEVLFHWVHNERGFTRPWEDGEPAAWIPQEAVDAVIEGAP